MLSDAEQHRLTEIETQLRADDPDFAYGFDKRGQGRLRSGRRQLAAVLGVVFALVVCGVGLAFGSVGAVVVALTAMGASLGLWVVQRRGL